MNKKLISVSVIIVVALILLGYIGIKIYGAKKVEKGFREFMEKTTFGEFYNVDVESFDYDPFSREYILKGVNVKPKIPDFKGDEFTAEEIRIKFEELKKGFTFAFRVKNSKSKFGDKIVQQDYSLLAKLEDEELEVKNETNVKGYFNVKYEMKLDNFDRKIFPLIAKIYRKLLLNTATYKYGNSYPFLLRDEDFMLLISKVMAIVPKYIEFEYEEKGFSEVLLDELAKQTGKDKEALRKEILKDIERELQKEKNENAKEFLEAIAYFIENKKGKIEVELKNKEDLSVQDLLAIVIANKEKTSDEFINKLAKKIEFKVEFKNK